MRYRVEYSKQREARFVSHLDTLKTMERVVRRGGVPIAFSEGFNPHPKIAFGSALAVGVTSDHEYLDLELSKDWAPERLKEALASGMPPGFAVGEVRRIADRVTALMSVINRADYLLRITPSALPIQTAELSAYVGSFLARPEIVVERETKKGRKQVDLRPGIFGFSAEIHNSDLIFRLTLQTGSSGNIRPEDVLGAFLNWAHLDADITTARIHRLGLYIFDGGTQYTPLEDQAVAV